MIHEILMKATENLPIRRIAINGQDYLERYYLGQFLGRTVYLHRFVESDGERHVHDHPWNAIAFVLTGRYIEEEIDYVSPGKLYLRWVQRCWYRPNWIPIKKFHRIASVQPNTWTLLIHGKRRKDWGFIENLRGNLTYVGQTYGEPTEWWKTNPKAKDIRGEK